jgi:hypothetical protein
MLTPLSDCETFVAARPEDQSRVDRFTRYLNSETPWNCKHGHSDCAIRPRGTCSNELLSDLYGLVDEDGQERLDDGDL